MPWQAMRARLGGGLYPIIFARYRFCGRNMNFLLTGMPWQAIRYGLRRSNTIFWAPRPVAIPRSAYGIRPGCPGGQFVLGWSVIITSLTRPVSFLCTTRCEWLFFCRQQKALSPGRGCPVRKLGGCGAGSPPQSANADSSSQGRSLKCIPFHR